MPTWLPALIGTAINAVTSLAGTHMRNEAQKRESELAYKRQQEAIREQNAYNSASAQMARLQAAGLNPNLMYDSGQQVAAGTQENIPEYQPAEMQSAVEPVGAAGSSMINDAIQISQLKNETLMAEAKAFLDYTGGDLNIEKLDLTRAQTNSINTLLGWQVDKMDAEIKEINQRTEESKSNQALIEQKAKESIQMIKESMQRVDNLLKEGQKIDAETYCMLALLNSKINFMEASAEDRAAAALEAYERMRYIGAYYTLETDKFDFEMTSFYDSLGWDKDSFHQSLKQGYWNIGLHTGVQILSLAASTVQPFLAVGSSVGGLFGRSPVTGMYGTGFGTSTVRNSPKKFIPATGAYVYRKPKAHK